MAKSIASLPLIAAVIVALAAAPALADTELLPNELEFSNAAAYCLEGVNSGTFNRDALQAAGYDLRPLKVPTVGAAQLNSKRLHIVWMSSAPSNCIILLGRKSDVTAEQIASVIQKPLIASPATDGPGGPKPRRVFLSTDCCKISVTESDFRDGPGASIWIERK